MDLLLITLKEFLKVLIFGMPVILLVILPLILRFKKFDGRLEITPAEFNPGNFPKYERLEKLSRLMIEQGFLCLGDYILKRRDAENNYQRKFIDPSNTIRLSISAEIFRNGVGYLSMAFATTLEDGTHIITFNSPYSSHIYKGAFRAQRYPLCNPLELLEIHKARVASSPANQPIQSTPEADQLSEIARNVSEYRDSLVDLGYLEKPSENTLRFTFKGAYMQMWLSSRSALLRMNPGVPKGAKFTKDPMFELWRTSDKDVAESEIRKRYPFDYVQIIGMPMAAIGILAYYYSSLAAGSLFVLLIPAATTFLTTTYLYAIAITTLVFVVFRIIFGRINRITVREILKVAGFVSFFSILLSLYYFNTGSQYAADQMAFDPMECAKITPCTDDCVDSGRFERVDRSLGIGTAKIRNRTDLDGTNACLISPGNFLSRIWAHYGPPDSVDYEGFTYVLRDTETGLLFTAYSAGTGPAYGGKMQDAEALEEPIRAFDRMLEATRPADCEITFDSDFGPVRSGARAGVPFDKELHPPPVSDL